MVNCCKSKSPENFNELLDIISHHDPSLLSPQRSVDSAERSVNGVAAELKNYDYTIIPPGVSYGLDLQFPLELNVFSTKSEYPRLVFYYNGSCHHIQMISSIRYQFENQKEFLISNGYRVQDFISNFKHTKKLVSMEKVSEPDVVDLELDKPFNIWEIVAGFFMSCLIALMFIAIIFKMMDKSF